MIASDDPRLLSLSRTLAARTVPGRALLVALDGAVAAGKSTLAASLAAALEALDVKTVVVSADGFLLPTAQLETAGLIGAKGFPESFDRPAMHAFLTALRRGEAPGAPVYAHDLYDVSPNLFRATVGAGVVIFEGVNVLQPDLADLYDYRLYLDAPEAQARARFTRRFMATPFTPVRAKALLPWRPKDGDPQAWADAVWAAINGPNLDLHIASGRARADLVLEG